MKNALRLYQVARHKLALELEAIEAIAVDGSAENPAESLLINLRMWSDPEPGPLTPELIAKVVRCMWHIQFTRNLQFNAVVGGPGGEPFAQELARLTTRPFIVLDLDDETPRVSGFSGFVPAGPLKALIVYDIIGDGNQENGVFRFLHHEGIEVKDAIAVIDCESGGREEMEEWGCDNLHAVFTTAELHELYSQSGIIEPLHPTF